MKKNTSAVVSEFLGTFFLVFAGTGAIVINDISGGVIGHPGIAAVFGLIVMAMIYTIGETSGAHMNPAVTIAFAAAGRFRSVLVLPYLIAQSAGAIAASMMLHLIFPGHDSLGATLPSLSATSAFAMELILTFLLMFVIIHVATGSREQGLMAGIAIGGTVLLEAMFAGPVTGASMNPARSLGPALVSGHLQFLWIYLVSTTLGAVMAVFVHGFIMNGKSIADS